MSCCLGRVDDWDEEEQDWSVKMIEVVPERVRENESAEMKARVKL